MSERGPVGRAGELTALQKAGDLYDHVLADLKQMRHYAILQADITETWKQRALKAEAAAKAPQGVPPIAQAAIDFYNVIIDKGFQDWDAEDCCRFCECHERGAHTMDCPFGKFAMAVTEAQETISNAKT